jgi:Restriction endonuclease
MLNGLTQGIYVTTSNFTKGAKETAQQFSALGYPIELVDAEKFLEHLLITKGKPWDINELDSSPAGDFWRNPRSMTPVSLSVFGY